MTNTIRLIRELKGAPLSIALALQCTPQRVTQAWLERATGYTDKPVSQGLAYLAEIGMVDHTQAGWGLVGEYCTAENCLRTGLEGAERCLGGQGIALTAEIAESAKRFLGEQRKACTTDYAPQITQIRTTDTTDYADCEECEEGSRNNSESGSQVVVVESNINPKDSTSTDLKTAEEAEIPSLEEVRQVLEAAAELFGSPILGDVRRYQELDLLLGWIAQVYTASKRNAGKIRNPAGLIYWAFSKGERPEKKYLERPERYLPDRFLELCGQYDCEQTPT